MPRISLVQRPAMCCVAFSSRKLTRASGGVTYREKYGLTYIGMLEQA